MEDERYYELIQFIGTRFHEDYELYGNTIAEIVASYTARATPVLRQKVVHQIDEFVREHKADLEAAFFEIVGNQFDPALWGHTAASFFDELKRLLQK